MVTNWNKILLLLLVLLLVPITASAYQINIKAPDSLKIGEPLVVDGTSTLGIGTPIDVVLYSQLTTPTEIKRKTAYVQSDYTFRAVIDTTGLHEGQYKVEAQFVNPPVEEQSSDSVTVQSLKLIGFSWPSLEIIPNQATLPSGTHVTVRTKIDIDAISSSNKIQVSTELDNPTWTYELVVNGISNTRPGNTANTWYISGFELRYKPTDSVSVRIGLDGTTPVTSMQMSKKIISIQETDSDNNAISSPIRSIEKLVGTPTLASTLSASQTTTATTFQTSKPTVITTISPSTSIRTAITTHTSTSKVTVKNPTPWPTGTPPQQSPLGIPLGIEIGIIATIGAVILVMKRK